MEGQGKGRISSAVLAIKQILHGLTPGGVRAFVGLQWISSLRSGIRVIFTARGTTIRKSGLSGPKLKFFTANNTRFDWIRHLRHHTGLL